MQEIQTLYITTLYDYVTVKYDNEGNRPWISSNDGLLQNEDIPIAIALDSEGFIRSAKAEVQRIDINAPVVLKMKLSDLKFLQV